MAPSELCDYLRGMEKASRHCNYRIACCTVFLDGDEKNIREMVWEYGDHNRIRLTGYGHPDVVFSANDVEMVNRISDLNSAILARLEKEKAEKFENRLEAASKEVKSWPEWKQTLLGGPACDCHQQGRIASSPTEKYDSAIETAKHIEQVSASLAVIVAELVRRAGSHDQSKFGPEEKPTFDVITPRLHGVTYGSAEYKETMREFAPAIEHHQHSNRHHPEYYATGVSGMTLVDLVEMIADWCAASKRHADGDLMKSIEINAVRFSLSPQLRQILENTAREYLR